MFHFDFQTDRNCSKLVKQSLLHFSLFIFRQVPVYLDRTNSEYLSYSRAKDCCFFWIGGHFDMPG